MNILFKWIIWILRNWIFVLNEYFRFKKYEYLFWMMLKDIPVFYCPHQKQSSPNVSNSSEIFQGSLVRPISVHFRGPWPIQELQEGSEAIFWPYSLVLNDFPPCFVEWIIPLNILDFIKWIFFWMNILDFVLNWIVFNVQCLIQWKKLKSPPLTRKHKEW